MTRPRTYNGSKSLVVMGTRAKIIYGARGIMGNDIKEIINKQHIKILLEGVGDVK